MPSSRRASRVRRASRAPGAEPMSTPKIVTVLEPEDEYTHEPDPVSNYNESMYLNGFDLQRELGAWFRIGNRVNEGYAEMTVCIYLPDGRVGFIYGRPEITSNDEMRAGGLEIRVEKPFEHLTISYDGKVCLLDEPRQMANPRTAFRDNPFVDCSVHLDVAGVSPMYGGMPQYEDDDRRTELAEALWATTLDKLAVANPSYREDS